LLALRRKIYDHKQRGGESAPLEADKPGEESSGESQAFNSVNKRVWREMMADWWIFASSGAKGVEYPQRFFARDFAGNRLEFSL
jgi:hypothetical protein